MQKERGDFNIYPGAAGVPAGEKKKNKKHSRPGSRRLPGAVYILFVVAIKRKIWTADSLRGLKRKVKKLRASNRVGETRLEIRRFLASKETRVAAM